MDNNAFFKLSYGLFVLTARQGDKDNGCIINTVMQVTDTPKQIQIAVNKQNFTHDMIAQTGKFNVSVLSLDAVFWVFQHYGFQSGRDVDKFADFVGFTRSHNGLTYLTDHTNAVFSCEVKETVNLGSHMLFIGEVTESKVLGKGNSCTYAHYHKAIKPKF